MNEPPLLHLHQLPGGPTAGTVIAEVSAIKPGESIALDFRVGNKRTGIFLHHGPDGITAFENSCPHAGTPLNLTGNRFTTSDGTYLLCQTHGAIFDRSNGVSVKGPCKGQYLRRIAIAVQKGSIVSA